MFIRLVVISLFVLPFGLSAQLEKISEVEGISQYRLDNGLEVLLFPDNSAQTVTVNITYKVGSRHEGYGEKGMAHLLEHMVFKGTPNHPDIPKELSSHGTRPNGTTWFDRTNYFETMSATDENLEWALDLEADRMVNSFISEEDLKSEFSVVRNEFEMGENSPVRVLLNQVIDAAYLWHNYGKSTIGNRSDIERVAIENLQAFYRKYYRPDNAVITITGKFDEAKTLQLVQQKFGPIAKPEIPIRDSYTVEPAQDGERFVNVSRVGDLQTVSALYHIPSGPDPDRAAMAILEKVLADTPSGRLYKALVETQKASSLWSFSPFTKEPGFVYINVSVPSDKDAEEVQQILRNVLDDVRNNPVTEEELERSRSILLKQMDEAFRKSDVLATYISEFIGAGDFRLGFIHRDRIESVSLEEVNAAASKYLIPTNRTVGRFIPTKNPERIEISHVTNLDSLVLPYVGKENKGKGEVFDVAYENIQQRLSSGELKNGIAYGVIEKDNRGQTVRLNFSLRNGDVNSLTNKGMIPSLTASMLNKGTASKSRQAIEDELSRLKTTINIYSHNGNVYVTLESTAENLLPALELMSDMLLHPGFAPEELEKLKTERLASLEANKTEPQFLAQLRLQQLNNSFSKGHPLYVMSIEEQEAAIRDVTVEEVKAFYREFYGLGKATLVSIGNLEEDQVLSFMQEHFSGFKSKLPYSEVFNPFKAVNKANEKIITPDKKNAFTLGTLSLNVSEAHPDYAALQIATTILGGGFLNSRLAERLRQKDGVSYGAGAFFRPDLHEDNAHSQVMLYAIYNPLNYEKVQLGFKEELDRFIREGVTEEELGNAVNGWIQEQTVSRAKDGELSGTLQNNLYFGRTMDFQQQIEARVESLTTAEIHAAIKKYIPALDQWSVVNAGDFNTTATVSE